MTWARAAIFSGSEVGKRWLQEHGVQGVAASALPALVTAGSVQCVNTPLFKATVALQDPRSVHSPLPMVHDRGPSLKDSVCLWLYLLP